MISDFHYMISVDDIHGNNIITTSIEYILLVIWKKLFVKFFFVFVYGLALLKRINYTQNTNISRWRDSL